MVVSTEVIYSTKGYRIIIIPLLNTVGEKKMSDCGPTLEQFTFIGRAEAYMSTLYGKYY